MSRISSHFSIRILSLLLLSYLLCATTSCGSKEKDKPNIAHIAVNFEFTGPQSSLASFSIISYTVHVSGCAQSKPTDFTIDANNTQHVLNLREGDTGCQAALQTVEIVTTTGVADILTASSTIVPAYLSSTNTNSPIIFSGSRSPVRIEVTTSIQLPSPISATGAIAFLIMPYRANAGTYSESVLVTSGTPPSTPGLIPLRVDDRGEINPGKRSIGIVMQCEIPLSFSACRDTELKDYLFLILPAPDPMFTEEEFLSRIAVGNSNTAMANESHYYGNGLKITLALEPADADLSNLIVITRTKNAVRYFRVSAQ